MYPRISSDAGQQLDVYEVPRLPPGFLETLLHRGELGEVDTTLWRAADEYIAVWTKGAYEADAETVGAYESISIYQEPLRALV